MDVNKVLIDAYIKEECYHFEDDEIIDNITKYLELYHSTFETGEIVIKKFTDEYKCMFNELVITYSSNDKQSLSFWRAYMEINPIRLLDFEPERNVIDGQDVSAFQLWELPNKQLHGLWQSIVTDPRVKSQLLGYCDTSIQFGQVSSVCILVLLIYTHDKMLFLMYMLLKADIDSNIISWNRMALCFGPPGTGNNSDP